MKVHPAGLAVAAGFALLMLLTFDLRFAAVAAVATVVVDWLSFGGLWQRRAGNSRVVGSFRF
jgi:dolichyl-phosphate-mannose--protein O-mannosyl transferase